MLSSKLPSVTENVGILSIVSLVFKLVPSLAENEVFDYNAPFGSH